MKMNRMTFAQKKANRCVAWVKVLEAKMMKQESDGVDTGWVRNDILRAKQSVKRMVDLMESDLRSQMAQDYLALCRNENK